MSEENETPEPASTPAEPVVGIGNNTEESDEDVELHWLQKLLDNPWLLLALGLIVPTLSYTVWGWVEIVLMKPAELP